MSEVRRRTEHQIRRIAKRLAMKFPAVRRVIESRNALEAERNMLKAERDLLRAELTAGRGAFEKERSMLRAEGDKLDGHRAPINEIRASVGRASSVSSLSLKEALKDVSDFMPVGSLINTYLNTLHQHY